MCSACSGTAAPDVFTVLSADSKDVAPLILGQLSLAALGVLACTCKSLRVLVEDAPGAWQAAAVREHASSHPIHSSKLGVPTYLQQQHSIGMNIASCKFTSVQRVVAQEPRLGHSLSVDCSTWVSLQAGGQLLVHSPVTGELLHTWALPPRLYCPAPGWDWDSTCSQIMLLFGTAWKVGCCITDTPDWQHSGVLLLDVHTGCMVEISIPDPQQVPLQGHVNLATVEWAGEHVLLTYTEGACVDLPHTHRAHICAHAPDGSLCNSIEWVSECGYSPMWQWAPCGASAYLLPEGASRDLFMWQYATGAPYKVSELASARWGAWSPSNVLLMGMHGDTVGLFSSQGRPLAPPQDLGFQATQGIFGHCGVAIAGSDKRLSLYTVEAHVLVLCHTLLCHWKREPALEFSPDGRHILCVSSSLVIITFRTATAQRFPLVIKDKQKRVCWASGAHIVQCAVTHPREQLPHRLQILCFE